MLRSKAIEAQINRQSEVDYVHQPKNCHNDSDYFQILPDFHITFQLQTLTKKENIDFKTGRRIVLSEKNLKESSEICYWNIGVIVQNYSIAMQALKSAARISASA